MKYLFIGISRSGNHAITDWWCSRFSSYIHQNNCEIATGLPAQQEFSGKSPFLHTVYSLENRSLEECEIFREWCEAEEFILIVRSFENWLSSIFNFRLIHPPHLILQDLINLYVEYGKWGLENPNNTIKFDDFIRNEKYRREIEKRFELKKCSDGTLNTISRYGNGSSFDNNINSIREGVIKRWEKFLDHPQYLRLIKNSEEAVNLSREIFGNFPQDLL